MALTTILAALALAQTPAPVPTLEIRRGSVTPLATVQAGRRVTLRFDGASLKDVLKRLQKEKIDFAVDADSFKDRKVTLSLTDVPLSAALDAIGSALDAHWETVGSVRVLKKGARSGFGTLDGNAFRNFTLPTMPALPKLDGAGQKEALRALEQAQKELADAKGMNEEQRKTVLKALEEAQKNLAGQNFNFNFTMPKGVYDFKSTEGFKNLSPKDNEEFRKAMERIRDMDKDALSRSYTHTIPIQGFDLKSLTLNGRGLGELLKSLTPEQKELQKKQGYLKPSDLTADQRKMAGLDGKGTVEITIVRNGETLKIKGE